MFNFNCLPKDYHPSPLLRGFQIFLLILIIVGLALIVTQNFWVPKLVGAILAYTV